jgi:hypothetical protein
MAVCCGLGGQLTKKHQCDREMVLCCKHLKLFLLFFFFFYLEKHSGV